MRLFTRRGNDWSDRFPAVIEAAGRLRAQSFTIDGEVVCCNETGLAVFALLRSSRKVADNLLPPCGVPI